MPAAPRLHVASAAAGAANSDSAIAAKVKNLPALTGLRGVCALWVMAFHLAYGSSLPVLSAGYLGVDVFFMLSGFILSHVYTGQITQLTPRIYLGFLHARFWRIYPLHFVCMMLLLAVVILLPGFASRYGPERFSAETFVASLALVQNWAHWLPTCWNTVAWSLSAEWFAYLWFPVLLTLVRQVTSARTALYLAVLSLGILVTVLTAKGIHGFNVAGTPGMVRMTFEFVSGCLLYRVYILGAYVPRATHTLIAVATVLIGALQPLLNPVAAFGFLWIILLASQDIGFISDALSRPFVLFLGEISYSLYMIHWMVIQLFNWGFSEAVTTKVYYVTMKAGLMLIIFAMSCGLYHGVERPARNLGRRLARMGMSGPQTGLLVPRH